jgi:hypothetical protein
LHPSYWRNTPDQNTDKKLALFLEFRGYSQLGDLSDHEPSRVETENALDRWKASPWASFEETSSVEKPSQQKNFKKLVEEFVNYCETEQFQLTLSEFWKSKALRFPEFIPVVKRFLSRPASSASCESLFSKAGAILTKNRSNLKPEHFCLLLSIAEFK